MLFPPASIGAELYALSIMPSASVCDWLRTEVLLPPSAVDGIARRLDSACLRLLYNVALHEDDEDEDSTLMRCLLRNLFGAAPLHAAALERLLIHLSAHRFPSWVSAKAASIRYDRKVVVDECGWPTRGV